MNGRWFVRSACLVLLACGVAAGCGQKFDPTGADGDKPVASRLAPGQPSGTYEAAEVRAEVVANESQNDPLAADRKFKGKTLIVEGPVKRLYRRPVPGAGVVVAVTVVGAPSAVQPEGTIVHCECRPEDEKRALELSPGQTVHIHGRCEESAIAPRNCTIESAGPDPSVRVSAAELVAEFLADQKAAEAKYKGKPLTLTDAVVERKYGGANNGRLVLVFEPKKSVAVTAKWPESGAADQKQFAAVKPGDRVTIKCWYARAVPAAITFEECQLAP